MNRIIANKLYLTVIVVISITIGFITGYIVGIKHSGPDLSEGNRSSGQIQRHDVTMQVGKGESAGTQTIQDIKQDVMGENQGSGESLKKEQGANPDVKKTQGRDSVDGEKVAEESGKKETRDAVYTVQVGAFRNEKEAIALKTKLEKKGYNINIIKERKSQGMGSLFKVRVGDFETKKEAEIFAVKLRRTEGLRAFAVKK